MPDIYQNNEPKIKKLHFVVRLVYPTINDRKGYSPTIQNHAIHNLKHIF